VTTDPRVAAKRQNYLAVQVRAVICVPLLKDGHFVACMAAHQDSPRNWTGFDVALFQGVASRCWESIERSRVTRELQASEARFRTITNTMPQIVWTASSSGEVEYYNERLYEFVGISPGPDDGAAWVDLVHPEDQLAAARPAHGRVLKWLGTNTDIDVQKRSEQAAQDANRRQVRHMTSLVDDLLDAARVTQGVITLHTSELDMKQVVADAAEQVRPLIEARRHVLSVAVPSSLASGEVHVQGDHKRLVQVLVNLLGNAAKYTPDGGRIELEMDAGPLDVSLCVRDAFGLFHQGQRTIDRAQGGLGIGLALVKSLVEQHGGRVAAHSDGLGHGSRFTVHLPRLATPAAPLPDDNPAAGAGARRILVVDDNVDAAQMVAMLLQVLGNQVTVEYDPLQALASARETVFDAFILDIGLPGTDGHELARQIRALPSARGALFIALTGYGQEQDREDSKAADFHYHFVKPADVNALSDALSKGVPG
jgi:signal transduction histidine kinase